MGVWIGLELNLLSFIPIISIKNNSYSSESSIKYFIIQAIASSILLISIIILIIKSKLISNSIINNSIFIIINSSLCLKLGAAPFHFWFPEIIEGINWINRIILITWQKIAPIIIIIYTIKTNIILYIIIILSTLIGSIGGLNQIRIRKILAFSSINHIGWIFRSILINETIWLIYFIVYALISISIILIFNQFKIFLIKQIFINYRNNKSINFLISINILSLGGLPPFLGFIPKWIIIQNIRYNILTLILFIIIITLITLFFYIRIIYNNLIIKNNELIYFPININIKLNNKTNLLSFISIFGLILYSIIINFI